MTTKGWLVCIVLIGCGDNFQQFGLEERPINDTCLAPDRPSDNGAMNDREDSFPQRLSQTGCVDTQDARLPASGLIPYSVNSPLWSDGAIKERYLAIPDGTTIVRAGNCAKEDSETCAEQGHWEFPLGSVLVKSFRFGERLLETRLLVRHKDGDWAGYTYIWNEEQTDAMLSKKAQTSTIDGKEWTFPSRSDCLVCHTKVAGGSLGLETRQLNGDFMYPNGRIANQMDTFEHIGLFSSAVRSVEKKQQIMPNPAQTADIGQAARSYLHSNCSMCHRPGGETGSPMDLRYTTSLVDMNICDVSPMRDVWHDVVNPRLFAPGKPERSLLSIRMHSLAVDSRMPPLGSIIVDETGVDYLDTWIRKITQCP